MRKYWSSERLLWYGEPTPVRPSRSSVNLICRQCSSQNHLSRKVSFSAFFADASRKNGPFKSSLDNSLSSTVLKPHEGKKMKTVALSKLGLPSHSLLPSHHQPKLSLPILS
ncbi:hypothetical protein AVEN_210334-1 [Araneus ventricosus]|uniref:Uncharacterized protein n=1 Tax=Araneus ventricosus TaxID=182803 RepID=A0A4Y2SIE6_ARAVE|nr:hypothetical protein AVEN_210334-1 [Araneus ventricosus]